MAMVQISPGTALRKNIVFIGIKYIFNLMLYQNKALAAINGNSLFKTFKVCLKYSAKLMLKMTMNEFYLLPVNVCKLSLLNGCYLGQTIWHFINNDIFNVLKFNMSLYWGKVLFLFTMFGY